MTNFEHWKDKLKELASTANGVGVLNGVPVNCCAIDCEVCDLEVGECSDGQLLKWLLSEYVEKPKLTKKERKFCELVETGWIARDADRRIWIFLNKPPKSDFGWSEIGHSMYYIFKDVDPFSFIKWEDEEPWSVEDLLKLEVEQ